MVQGSDKMTRKDYWRKFVGGVCLLGALCLLQGAESWALEKSLLLDKGVKALKSSFGPTDIKTVKEELSSRPPVIFIYDDEILLKWQKGVAKGSFIGVEGHYDFGSSFSSSAFTASPALEKEQRVTFDVKAALGVSLSEKSRIYFFTGASNAGLHISENRYHRDADFYLGVGFEINLTDQLKLRAEYNLTNYGKNWVRDGFSEINQGQGEDQTFLTRMLWPF